MTDNDIPERQNLPASMRLLRARSETYRRATRLQLVQIVATVVMPVAGAVLGLLVVETRPVVAALAICLTLVDIGLIDRAIKRRLKTAALICEKFDCDVLSIPWNRFAVGKAIEPEAIAEADRRWPKGDLELVDWYPRAVGMAPLHLGRIICQRTNLWYDARLREHYSSALIIGAVAIVVGLVIAGLASNLPFTDFVITVIVPSAPVLSWTLRDAFRQRDAAEAQKLARAEAEALWALVIGNGCDEAECTRRSREFQNSIFQRRVSNPLLFPLVYRYLRAGMEIDMNRGAVDLLHQAGVKCPDDGGDSHWFGLKRPATGA